MQLDIQQRIVIDSALGQNPSIGRASNGDLLLLHTDLTDCMAGTRLLLRRSVDAGRTWSAPEREIVSEMELGGVEGTISCLGDLVFIVHMEGSDLKRRPENPRLTRLLRSTDGGRTFEPARTLEGDWGPVMPFGHVIRLRENGRLLLPAYRFGRPPEDTRVQVLTSDDEGLTWALAGTILRRPDITDVLISETSLLELPDGRLLAISRGDAIAAGAFPYGFRAVSTDGGRSWSAAEPINLQVCEPRLTATADGQIVLAARSWPGNVRYWYRPLRDEEREPGSQQKETVDMVVVDEYATPVRDFGVLLFSTADEGFTWEPQLTLESPRPSGIDRDVSPLVQHRYQAGYPDVLSLDVERLIVVFRQPDATMPDIRLGLTYSHAFQRYVAANIVRVETSV